MVKGLSRLLIAGLLPLTSSLALAQGHHGMPANPDKPVSSTGRHVYIVHQGLDKVLGSYLFLVTNSTKDSQTATIPLMLPRGVEEFVPGEGVKEKEIKLNSDGSLQIEKSFPPGEQLISVNFTLPAKGGTAKFTITPTDPISTIKLMSPTGTLSFAGETGTFKLAKEVPFSKRVYDTLSVMSPKLKEPYSLTIGDVPEGRADFWQLGIVMAALMLGVMIAAATTRLKRPAEASDSAAAA